MSAAIEPVPAQRRRIGRGTVTGAVRAWLRERDLEGADLVRARMALALAAELDDPAAPRYAKAKISSELRTVMNEIEVGVPRDDVNLARRMLEELRLR